MGVEGSRLGMVSARGIAKRQRSDCEYSRKKEGGTLLQAICVCMGEVSTYRMSKSNLPAIPKIMVPGLLGGDIGIGQWVE